MLSIIIFLLLHSSAFRKKVEQSSEKEDSGEAGCASEENESAELRRVLEIENSTLFYICVVGNYRQTTAVKRAACNSLIQMAVHNR